MDINHDLSILQEFVDEANQSNSANYKLEVIKKYPQLQDMWKWVYDTINYQYGITSKNIKKIRSKLGDTGFGKYSTIHDLLTALSSREITGHAAISEVLSFINCHVDKEDLIFNIIDRNLKTRTDAKLINKAFPGCIPRFEVALATDYDEYDPDGTKIDFEKDVYFASRKLDGCRCVVMQLNENDIKAISRGGKEFLTLQKVLDEIKSKVPSNGNVFDGEICLLDENGNENFQTVMKYIRKKDYTIENPRLILFDWIPYSDFEGLYCEKTLSERHRMLRNTIPPNNTILHVLDQIRIKDLDHLKELRQHAASSNWEGLIIRKDVPYEGKRSNDMLKVKMFKDAEFVITNVEMGPIRYIDYDKEAKAFEREDELLSAVMFQFKENTVRVGSGFSLEQRKYFHAHPEELIGRQITVKYFEETTNQEGGNSIRFPTIKVLHPIGGRDA